MRWLTVCRDSLRLLITNVPQQRKLPSVLSTAETTTWLPSWASPGKAAQQPAKFREMGIRRRQGYDGFSQASQKPTAVAFHPDSRIPALRHRLARFRHV